MAKARSSAPRGFFRNLKIHLPSHRSALKMQKKILDGFLIKFWQSSAIWVAVECSPSSTWVQFKAKSSLRWFLVIVNLWAAVWPPPTGRVMKNLELSTRNQEPRTKNRLPKNENQAPWTENQEPWTENQEPGTKNQEPKTKNQKP
jgi:hypothetical protein